MTGLRVRLGSSSSSFTSGEDPGDGDPDGWSVRNGMWICSETSAVVPEEEDLPAAGTVDLDCRDGGFDPPPARC